MSNQDYNLSAHIAKCLVRRAHAKIHWQRWAIFISLVATLILFSVWGVFLELHPKAERHVGLWLLDAVYAPFTYLVPDNDLAFAYELAWPRAVARLVGPVIPLLGIIWLARRRLNVALAQWLLRNFSRNHAVIVGMRGSADNLALQSSKDGEVVILADPSALSDEGRLLALGEAGVTVIAGPHDLLKHAGTLVVHGDSDLDNLEEAIRLRAACISDTPEIHVNLRSPDLHRALLHAPELLLDGASRLRPHSPEGNAVRMAFKDPELLELAINRKQPAVKLCLWGGGPTLQWVAEFALRQFWSVRLGAPQIIVVIASGEAERSSTLTRFSELAPVVFGPDDPPLVQWQCADTALKDEAVTCHVVDAGSMDSSVNRCFELAARLKQGAASAPPLQPILDTDRDVSLLFKSGDFNFRPLILLQHGLTISSIRDRLQDEQAALLHMAYEEGFGGIDTPARGRWQDLQETYVAANRAIADHVAVKRWDLMGCGLSGDALIERMAQNEHSRWCAERLLGGWIPSGNAPRDNERRLHPDLRPWAELSAVAKDKDRSVVCGLI